ncbi:MAG: Rieske 2Fe-2S domain-containing protein [Kineosporiaceae bacterium]|nr:Rieske 2Fe-2S domain-containing protein [Kineosporiaceae bacterium]
MSESQNLPDVVSSDSHGTVATSERFDDPGLPPHRHRVTDIDPAAAKRAERQVAALFAISGIGTVLAMVFYFALPYDTTLPYTEFMGRVKLSTALVGLGLFLALFGIGAGAVHWAKTLMPDEERVEDRHDLRGSDEDRAAALDILAEGAEESGLGRRPLIRNSLIGAMALAPLPAVVLLSDLGPRPGNKLSETIWKKGTPLVLDPQGGKIKASDLVQGSVAHVMPEGIEEVENVLNEKSKASVLVMRLDPELLDDASRPGSYDGIVAYSKICTHMGCPVALYEQQTHHLLCPCHQSTFDLKQNCKVIFGPARRPLPQLPITVDEEGYLVAADAFSEPVGPSFWERG